MLRMMKRAAVAESKTRVHRQRDETMRGEVLIHGVAVAVVIHVMPAEQHLPWRATVDENYPRLLVAGFCAVVEPLPMHQGAISRAEGHLFGTKEFRHWEIRIGCRRQSQSMRSVEIRDCHGRRLLRACGDERYTIGRGGNRHPFQRFSRTQGNRIRMINRHSE